MVNIEIVEGDITKIKNVDAMVSAANGIGVTGLWGGGVAGAIRRAAGDAYAQEVRKVGSAANGHDPGSCYWTSSGDLSKNNVGSVLHAVTMKYPGSSCSYQIVEELLPRIFEEAIAKGCKSIAIPGLGTGIGHLDASTVARMTVRAAKKHGAPFCRIVIADIDPNFTESASQELAGDNTP